MYFFIFSLLFSGLSFSCPDLQGEYARCSQNAQNVRIEQSVENKITTYNITSGEQETEKYRADGKPDIFKQTDPNTGVKIEIATTAKCDGRKSLNIVRTFSFDGEILGRFDIAVSKNAHQLIIVNILKSEEGEIKEEIVCE